MPAETFFIPLALSYAIFFILRSVTIPGALIAPCLVLFFDVLLIVVNFLSSKSYLHLFRQFSIFVLAALPLLVFCVKH